MRRQPLRQSNRATLFAVSLVLAAAAVAGTAASLNRSPADGAGRIAADGMGADGAGVTAGAPTIIKPDSPGPGSPDATTPVSPTSSLVWSDEFSEPAGASPYGPTWRFALGGSGWGNSELECYTDARDNSVLDGAGNLVLTARYAPGHVCSDGAINDYTSARIDTEMLRTLQYGHVRVRAQLPTASGAWPAIWALGADGAQTGYPGAGEIDIAEVVGQSPNVVHGTLHGPTQNGVPYSASASATLAAPASAAFHVYGIDWTPSSVAFSVDGRVYSTIDRADVQQQGGEWVFDKPFYLLLDVAVGGTFPGPPDDPGAYPQSMRVDYVRVYS